jgi:putative SOS response-associated peptidase YedK
MCGRFVSASPPEEIGKYFDTAAVSEKLLEPSYNVAPTNDVYVVTEDGGTRRLDAYHWGLVPFWAKSPAAGSKMINARAETIAEKNAYRRPFAKRRCIIPADGFYEWKKVPGQKAKQPYFITRRDEEPLAFAGIWEIWRGPDKAKEKDAPEQLRSCTIITTSANETMAPIHDRMPVILPASKWDEWLDPGNDDTAALGELLVPAPPTLLRLQPVSTEVNNVRNKGAQLIEPAVPAEPVEGAAAG